MNHLLADDLHELMATVPQKPSVSIILPFEKQVNFKENLKNTLHRIIDDVIIEIQQKYPDDSGSVVINKLKKIVNHLDFNTHKKSIVIYISPVFEKVFYLDILAGKKIVIDDGFEIRDLIYSKKQGKNFIVMMLSGKQSRLLLGDGFQLMTIFPQMHESVYAYVNEVPERVANFDDISERRQVITDKFLHGVDEQLDTLLNIYNLPVFVMGAEKIMGYFKKQTKHKDAIVGYIHGNYEEATHEELKKVIDPYIADWQYERTKNLINQLEEAANDKKLSVGIREVWHDVMNNKNGRLLVVESDFMYATTNEDSMHYNSVHDNHNSQIRDAVDVLIERLIENGGDVEFANKGELAAYKHIALVRYY